MINWAKYFDKIICICYNQFTNRKKFLQFQLDRVGILNSGIFEWHITFQDQYLTKDADLLQLYTTNHIGEYSKFSCTKGHIDTIIKAYYEGCKRILILEDDVRFLRDLNKIEQILQNIPDQKDWEVILFDKAVVDKQYIKYFNIIKDKKNLVNRYFCKFSNLTLLSSACYCLNKKGIELFISCINSNCITYSDFIFNNIKKYNNSFFTKRLFSIINLSIPVIFSNNLSISLYNLNIKYIQHGLKNQDINFDDYMMRRDGSPYNYGDYIEE